MWTWNGEYMRQAAYHNIFGMKWSHEQLLAQPKHSLKLSAEPMLCKKVAILLAIHSPPILRS